ncbi:hypothetical protein [Planktothrix agardhii]|uniref:hypothetical protein n=1 Tax=Planktothrix agardhii TaxID=1160 RepID=UPI0020A6F98F|nr:hypothetical protein [Planktothrix agardhii]CAD5975852.1 hypothetical protein NO758_04102 [Planktothrix agardhii]
MEIFINEVSLEGQYFNDAEFKEAVKAIIAIFEMINGKIKDKQIYKDKINLSVYEAVKGSNFSASLNRIQDRSLKTAFTNIVFNKLNAKEWREEQLHSSTDSFDCLMSNEEYKIVNDTSLAEVAERKLQNSNSKYLLINFINSSFNLTHHPHITKCCLITIIKNSDEVNCLKLEGLDNKSALKDWLEHTFNLSRLEYDESSKDPPTDEQTILREEKRFKKTSRCYHGRSMYHEIDIDRYWYVDNLHFGKAAHLEVFNKAGNHLGEADLKGNIDESKKDEDKTIKPP